MKHKKVLTVSLISLLAFTILVGLLSVSRLSILTTLAKENGVKQSETSLNITSYGFVEESVAVFNIFEYFRTEQLQWTGKFPAGSPEQQNVPVTIGLGLSYVEFKKVVGDPDKNYTLKAENMEFSVDVGDVAAAFIKADFVDINITYWKCEELPAMNLTAILTGSVTVSLSTSVLPLPGLDFVAYHAEVDQYVIRVCIIKPIEITLNYPEQGDTVFDDVIIGASIKTAPGITVSQAKWWVDGESKYEGEMTDMGSGVWEGVWETRGPNGKYRVNVQAVGVQEDVQGSSFPVSDWVEVQVNNPPFTVNAWCLNDSDSTWYQFNVPIRSWHYGEQKEDKTPFNVERYRGQELEVNVNVEINGQPAHFMGWAFSETGNPNDGVEWMGGAGEHIGIDNGLLEQVYHRQLLCLYKKEG